MTEETRLKEIEKRLETIEESLKDTPDTEQKVTDIHSLLFSIDDERKKRVVEMAASQQMRRIIEGMLRNIHLKLLQIEKLLTGENIEIEKIKALIKESIETSLGDALAEFVQEKLKESEQERLF